MFNVAILGFGTVGSGVYEVIKENNALLKQKTGEDIAVKKILDIRDFPDSEWESLVVHDIKEIIEDNDIDAVVETMGGTSPAFEFVRDALLSGKHVTTSNKALVAAHGTELLKIAKEKNVNFFFEASVGGGIPIIRTLTESYAGEHFKEITGILNGTTNYILTKMDAEGEDFEKALSTAQELGYAERNPEADVQGHDTCRKIAILASLATGKEVNFEEIYTEGITKIDTTDFEYAKYMKLSIKLFGDSKFEDGMVYAFVAPVMVERDHPLYMVNDVFNGIMVEGNMLGKSMLYGSGAGKLPTASAVVADIIAITKNKDKNIPFGWVNEKQAVADMSETSHKYFVRFKGKDTQFINKCKETFKDAKEVYLDGKDEFALVTGLMKEKDFLMDLNNLGSVIKYIRTKIA
ncbi:homoserine dehydrogenase, NAD dependent [Lachnoanaerobaculum saburreum F0468]|jgi:homoserine dehydrogenase|uniref:Homoserine dehydrogenase n=1 Tax=Lachnoanaerobaculum saburreum F0468 TaxID=1095750 RepID=I0R5H6_9FIRM|nr:homoserine dehydrogenase [Lachnoanaerobaculum saburreum]EIC94934.1 homoserine dehydrogenase, NAD dependent [Lachnoanaerobaculum saburreum F0468]